MDVLGMEHAVMEAMHWQLGPPTVSSWLQALYNRLNVNVPTQEIFACMQTGTPMFGTPMFTTTVNANMLIALLIATTPILVEFTQVCNVASAFVWASLCRNGRFELCGNGRFELSLKLVE